MFTAELSSSLKVVAEAHGEETQPIIVDQLKSSVTDTATAPVNELNPVTNDDALIVHYQDRLYLVDLEPEQPVILVNKGGNLNGVFLNAKIKHSGIIYEVDDTEKKMNNKVWNNKFWNEPFTLINLNSGYSGYSYKGSVSEEEEKVCSIKPLVVKEKGCKTDSELEQFGIIKCKINSKDDTTVMKVTEDGKKNETPPHVPASVTKDDTPVTKPTEPASVTKYDTPVTKPTDAKNNGEEYAPAPVRSSLTDTATAPVNKLNPVDDSKECRDNKYGDVNKFVPHGIKLYYCSDCPETFWMERGLEIHSDAHPRQGFLEEMEEDEERKKLFVEAMQKMKHVTKKKEKLMKNT